MYAYVSIFVSIVFVRAQMLSVQLLDIYCSYKRGKTQSKNLIAKSIAKCLVIILITLIVTVQKEIKQVFFFSLFNH